MSQKKPDKALRKDFERIIRALRRKAQEFREKGDLTRAENCEILAKELEEFFSQT